jgi:hypothetical protein
LIDSITKNFGEEMEKWPEAWKEDDAGSNVSLENWTDDIENLCTVGVSKGRKIGRFGIPVREVIEQQVRKHVLGLSI